MKKLILLLLLFVFTTLISAQNESSITEKLAATAKIWGFLKYYHPEVADGKYNWDEQLIAILPKVKMATSTKELSQVFYLE